MTPTQQVMIVITNFNVFKHLHTQLWLRNLEMFPNENVFFDKRVKKNKKMKFSRDLLIVKVAFLKEQLTKICNHVFGLFFSRQIHGRS